MLCGMDSLKEPQLKLFCIQFNLCSVVFVCQRSPQSVGRGLIDFMNIRLLPGFLNDGVTSNFSLK